jgi:hypothetical protein
MGFSRKILLLSRLGVRWPPVVFIQKVCVRNFYPFIARKQMCGSRAMDFVLLKGVVCCLCRGEMPHDRKGIMDAYTLNNFLTGLQYRVVCECGAVTAGDEPDDDGAVWWCCNECQDSGWVEVSEFRKGVK